MNTLLNKQYLPVYSHRLNKDLLPFVEGISKAGGGHKYKRKYRKGNRWVYVYEDGRKQGHHIHTEWNNEEHHPHEAPDSLREQNVSPKGGEYQAKKVHHEGDANPPKDATHVVHDTSGPKLEITTKSEFLEKEKGNLKQIGEGSGSAEVYIYEAPGTGAKFVIRFAQDEFDGFEKGELHLSAKLGDLGIAPVTYEYRDNGTLDDFHVMELAGRPIHELSGDERQKANIAALEHMKTLHLMGYAHNDLENPNNILGHKKDGAKLIDFQTTEKSPDAIFDEMTYNNHIIQELLSHSSLIAPINELGDRFVQAYENAAGDEDLTQSAVRMWYDGLKKIIDDSKQG